MMTITVSIDPSNLSHREALDALLDALGDGSVETAKPTPAKATAATEKPKAEAPKKKPEAEQIKLETVRATLATKVNEHREAIKEKLVALGAKNVTTLDVEHYGDFIKFLEAL